MASDQPLSVLALVLTLFFFLAGLAWMPGKRLIWEPRGPLYSVEQPIGEVGIRDFQYRHQLILRIRKP